MAPLFTKSDTKKETDMKIKFLRDCGLGKENGKDKNGKEGKTAEVEHAVGVELIQCSAAVEVKGKKDE